MTTALTVGAIGNTAVVVGNNNPFNSATKADWIAYCDIKNATQKTYDKAVESFFRYLHANGINQPSREDVISYREWLLNSGYKESSARLYVTIIKKFFRWLSSKGLYLNVADGVKLPKINVDEHARDALSIEEAKASIAACTGTSEKDLRDRAILSLMIGAGLRSVEIVRANIGDIEKRRGMWFIKVYGKARDGKSDSVALSPSLKKILDDYLSVRKNATKADPLFVSTANRNRGQRLQTQSISGLAKRVFTKLGIKTSRLTCHSCRHTHATLALEAGVSLREVSKNLRHKNSQVTEVYLHDLDRYNNRSVAVVSNLLFGE